MNQAIRWIAALLSAILITAAAAPPAEALNISGNAIKKVAVVGVVIAAIQKIAGKAKHPAVPKVPIPGQTPDKPAAKKSAKQLVKEQAAADKQAANQAFEQLAVMAQQGDIQAQYILGIASYTGRQTPADPQTALTWWRKASNGGHPDAGAYMGLAYAQGLGSTPQDPAEAKRRWQLAEEAGSPLAAVLLGLDGYQTNTPADKAVALQRFRTAAQQGNPQAKDFLQRIERKGTDAQLPLGVHLDWKAETAKTPLAGYYTQAGSNAFWGRIVSQDYAVAVRWWRMAADQNYAPAQALLGTAYYTGRGAEHNETKAVALFKAAAEQNDPLGQYMLGKAYLDGDAVQINKDLALKLFRAAAAAGIDDARRQAEQLEQEGL